MDDAPHMSGCITLQSICMALQGCNATNGCNAIKAAMPLWAVMPLRLRCHVWLGFVWNLVPWLLPFFT